MQIIAKLHTVQEVGNVQNRQGVNEKHYFSIYAINNSVFFVCMKYDVLFPFLYEKINFSVYSVICRFHILHHCGSGV